MSSLNYIILSDFDNVFSLKSLFFVPYHKPENLQKSDLKRNDHIFSPPLELENRSPGRSIQVFPTDHPCQKASAPTCHAVITFPSSPKQPTEEGYLRDFRYLIKLGEGVANNCSRSEEVDPPLDTS